MLNRPLAQADPAVRSAIEVLVERLAADDAGKIAGHVRRAAMALLVNGSASESDVALACAMHRRTLNRRLQAEDTAFQTILKDVRYEAACRLLLDTDNAVGEIAIAVGYTEASSFVRAFRQWTGTTPAEWRNRNGAKGAAGNSLARHCSDGLWQKEKDAYRRPSADQAPRLCRQASILNPEVQAGLRAERLKVLPRGKRTPALLELAAGDNESVLRL